MSFGEERQDKELIQHVRKTRFGRKLPTTLIFLHSVISLDLSLEELQHCAKAPVQKLTD